MQATEFTVDDFIVYCKAYYYLDKKSYADRIKAAKYCLIANGQFTEEYLEGLQDGINYAQAK